VNIGNCLKCGETIAHVLVEPVDVRDGLRSKWHGVSFLCPHCHAVVGVGIDPFEIQADMLHGIDKLLHRAMPRSEPSAAPVEGE
jgi:hypothetical protein